jgi:hypothetical protein
MNVIVDFQTFYLNGVASRSNSMYPTVKELEMLNNFNKYSRHQKVRREDNGF